MKTAAAALAALLASTGTLSAERFTFSKDGREFTMAIPHERWFSRPLIGAVTVYDEPVEYVREMCTEAVGKFEDMACTLILPGKCLITINYELPEVTYKAVLHHETAHCHGWPADHPED